MDERTDPHGAWTGDDELRQRRAQPEDTFITATRGSSTKRCGITCRPAGDQVAEIRKMRELRNEELRIKNDDGAASVYSSFLILHSNFKQVPFVIEQVA